MKKKQKKSTDQKRENKDYIAAIANQRRIAQLKQACMQMVTTRVDQENKS